MSDYAFVFVYTDLSSKMEDVVQDIRNLEFPKDVKATVRNVYEVFGFCDLVTQLEGDGKDNLKKATDYMRKNVTGIVSTVTCPTVPLYL